MRFIDRTEPGQRGALIARRWTLMLALTLLGGCGSVKLHSEVRQKQGEDAKKAWTAVDLKGYFDTEQDNLAKLLAEEIDSSRRLAAALRENEIQRLAALPLSGLRTRFDTTLGGFFSATGAAVSEQALATHEVSLTKAESAVRREHENGREIERDQSFLKAMGVPDFSCAQFTAKPRVDVDRWAAANAPLATEADRRIKSVTAFCTAQSQARTALDTELSGVKGGVLREAYLGWSGSRNALQALEGDVVTRKAAYQVALKAYNDEVALAAPGKSATESVKDKAAQVAKALKGLEDLMTTFGDQAASAERLGSINDLLANLQAGTEADAKTASKGELVASMLPAIADSARAIGQAAKGSDLVSLLIQRDIEQANLGAATVQVTLRKKDLVLQEALTKAVVAQAFTYARSRRFLHAVADCSAARMAVDPCPKSAPDAAGALSPDKRKTLLESLTLYLDAFSRQQATIDSLSTQYLALERERTLELSKVHATMWRSLIGATVDQAAEYAALGLKAEHFERLLHLIGVYYIGHGVNK